ncbi:reprolysin family zinc metalloprotease [Ancylostoma ceylanicum]|uniref:Reprolysin family zinc metalloprotease n=1 Tax=Ancylostoma ceylanicum TaxID=53326 RepID=A0A0D6M7N0_9BILA|nr:reprolysin family zinc metalloprotease [Ancylostoma ceylanicum]
MRALIEQSIQATRICMIIRVIDSLLTDTYYKRLLGVKQHGYSDENSLTYMLEAINVADLMFSRDLNVRLSVVYAEIWLDVQRIDLFEDIERTMSGVVDYSTGHIYNIAKDASILFTGGSFANHEAINSVFRSICTARAAALVKFSHLFEMHFSVAESMTNAQGLKFW